MEPVVWIGLQRWCEFHIIQNKLLQMGLFKIELEDQVLHKETWTFIDMASPSMVGQGLLQKTKDQYSIIRVNTNHSGTTWSLLVVVLQSFIHLTVLQHSFNCDTVADSKSGRQLRICCGLFNKPCSKPRKLDVIHEEQWLRGLDRIVCKLSDSTERSYRVFAHLRNSTFSRHSASHLERCKRLWK